MIYMMIMDTRNRLFVQSCLNSKLRQHLERCRSG